MGLATVDRMVLWFARYDQLTVEERRLLISATYSLVEEVPDGEGQTCTQADAK